MTSVYVRDPAHTPDRTSVPADRPPTEPDDYMAALVGVLEQLERHTVTCEACGCLCLSDEVCPSCRVASRGRWVQRRGIRIYQRRNPV